MTEDPLQVDLHDDDLMDEVQLTATLMVAANRSDSALSTAEIDRLLGVCGCEVDACRSHAESA